LLYRKPKFVPVILHNLANYDEHLFIKNLGRHIDCIPNNEENYISFSKSVYDCHKKLKYKIRCIDSFKFMARSLETLTNNFEKQQFKHTKQIFSD